MADIAVIIPAHNEAPRIAPVIEACKASSYVLRVLVVDDGSTDETSDVARRAGADVLGLSPNRGKARAMDAGVESVPEQGVCFIDADLEGLTSEHVNQLIRPYLFQGVKMTVGTIHKTHKLLWPVLSGARCMSRAAWRSAVLFEPELISSGYGVEIGLTILANRLGWRTVIVNWSGVHDSRKETKWGGSKVGRSALMWSRIVHTASRMGGHRLYDDLLQHLLPNKGFAFRR